LIAQEAQYRDWMLAALMGDTAAYRMLLSGLTRHLRSYFARRLDGGAAEDAVWYAPGNDPLVITVGCLDENQTVASSDDSLCPISSRGITEDGQQVFLTRSFNHIGARQDPSFAASGFAKQVALIEAGKVAPVIEVGNLDASRDFTDVRDTVRAYRDIVERGRPGVVYNVCSGKAYKIRDVLDRLIALSRVSVQVRVDPARFRPNDTPLLVGDPGRLKHDVGWEPSIELDQTLCDLLDYWRKEVE